jgi:WD40 repeat protein
VKLWRVSDGTLLDSIEVHTGWVRGIAFAPNGKALASVSGDNTVNVWWSSDGTLLDAVEGNGENLNIDKIEVNAGSLYSVAFAPDGQTLAIGAMNGIVKLWQIGDGFDTYPRTLGGHGIGSSV